MLNIIAYTDLPGNYRLIRLESATLCNQIQAGDTLLISSLPEPLSYLRHQPPKIDFLFYITPENEHLVTHAVIADDVVQHHPLALPDTDDFRILICPAEKLAQGLTIALAAQYKNKIDLFLFELIDASPFKLQPSQLYLTYLPSDVIANMAILEEPKIAARFYSQKALPGCFNGTIAELLAEIEPQLKPRKIALIKL